MNILVVDDNNLIRKVVSAIIQENQHSPILADGHIQALEQLEKNDIDLILMDIEMPDVNGFQLTEIIRDTYKKWIPIIFLSSNESESYLARGIDAGGDDYLTKPVKEVILSAKIRAMSRISQMKKELDNANQRLEVLSSIDSLTGLYNRRSLESKLTDAWMANTRMDSELSLLMIDIDSFKSYNDNYGHPKGDECLAKVAEILSSMIKNEADFIARYGGEEFILVLPHTSLEKAITMAASIKQALAEAGIIHEFSDAAPYVTVSIGLSSTVFNANSFGLLIQQADKALYVAKNTGRNKSETYTVTTKN